MSEDEKFSTTNWWQNLMDSAKTKSKNAIQVIKGDLAEFKSTMSNDASNLFLSTKSNNDANEQKTDSLLNSITKSFNEIKHNFNLSLNEQTNSLLPETVDQNTITTNSINERLEKEIEKLQNNENTYTENPIDPHFPKWIQSFNPDDYKDDISKMLIENSTIRIVYSQKVPAKLTNDEFWARYFFKVNFLKQEYMKRIKLIEKAELGINNQKDIDWDDEDENCENVDSQNNLKTTDFCVPGEDSNNKSKDNVNETTDLKTEQIIKLPDQLKTKSDENDEWEKITMNENENEKFISNDNLAIKRESLLNKIDKIESKKIETDWEEWE